MKKLIFRALTVLTVSLFFTVRAEITASISPAELTVVTGDVANFEFTYACSEGETLYSYFLPIERTSN